MTAILRELRALDARLDRGDITADEHARRRRMLLSSVEDAQPDMIDITPREVPIAPSPKDPSASIAASLGLVVVLGVMGLCIALALVFLDNMNLALTLGVTILAALSVALLRNSDG